VEVTRAGHHGDPAGAVRQDTQRVEYGHPVNASSRIGFPHPEKFRLCLLFAVPRFRQHLHLFKPE
jgi:hypothetical protein